VFNKDGTCTKPVVLFAIKEGKPVIVKKNQ
jgi:hypothetical protein